MIQRAKELATKLHEGQFRKHTGEPYINHPERVVKQVLEVTNDEEVIAAAWLHDVIEDCGVTEEYLKKEFNSYVSMMVAELTNPSKGVKLNRYRRKKMDRLHIKNASYAAQLIKICDRIDNLSDLKKHDEDFAYVYACETLLLLNCLDKAPQELVDKLHSICTSILWSEELKFDDFYISTEWPEKGIYNLLIAGYNEYQPYESYSSLEKAKLSAEKMYVEKENR